MWGTWYLPARLSRPRVGAGGCRIRALRGGATASPRGGNDGKPPWQPRSVQRFDVRGWRKGRLGPRALEGRLTGTFSAQTQSTAARLSRRAGISSLLPYAHHPHPAAAPALEAGRVRHHQAGEQKRWGAVPPLPPDSIKGQRPAASVVSNTCSWATPRQDPYPGHPLGTPTGR